MPYLARDVFLDIDRRPETVIALQLERIALARGYAIGIGHPYDATIDVVQAGLRRPRNAASAVVPISVIARFNFALRG